MNDQGLSTRYGMHTMNSFEFESGKVLENVEVEYSTTGIPKYDDEGNITNAVLYCPTVQGGISVLPDFYGNIKKYGFDKNEFFFIRVFSLGTPGSCSPSTTDLKYDFPEYTFKDRVNFKKQFLAEKFNLHKIFGAIGEGTGGFEIFTLACEYPDDLDFMIVVNSSYKTYGYRYLLTKCMEGIVDSSENYFSEGYSSSLSKLYISIFRMAFTGYFPQKIFETLSNDELDVLMEDYVDESLFMDMYDFKYRVDAILKYDVEDKLANIKAKSLIIGLNGYLFVYPTDVLPLKDLINGSQVKMLDSKKENYYEEADNSELVSEVISFLDQYKK